MKTTKKTLRILTSLALVVPLLFVGFIILVEMSSLIYWAKALISSILVVILILFLIYLSKLDWKMGYYECPECHHKFIPTYAQYLFAPHTFNKRLLSCPKCEEKSWCKKIYEENEEKSDE